MMVTRENPHRIAREPVLRYRWQADRMELDHLTLSRCWSFFLHDGLECALILGDLAS